MAKEVIAPKVEECEHKLKLAPDSMFVFCTECGSRWSKAEISNTTTTFTYPYRYFTC